MRMTSGSMGGAAFVALALAVVALAIAISPMATAASSGSEYPMEIIRAHTVYQVADPVATSVGIGVFGNR